MQLVQILRDSLVKRVAVYGVASAQITSYEQAKAAEERFESEWAATPLPELQGLSPVASLQAMDDPEEWVEFLATWCELSDRVSLPGPLWRTALTKAPTIAPRLVAKAESDVGIAGSVAIRLLGEARVAEALPVLVQIAESVPEFTERGDEAVRALTALGEAARGSLYELCDRYLDRVDSVPYTRAVEVLAQLARHDRTWHYLRAGLRDAKEMVGLFVNLAGDYGDPRAVFHLNTMLEERTDLPRSVQKEIVESIELCDGIPTAKGLERSGMLQPSPSKVGRNDACPCGSGKKYKKCCGR